MTTGLAGCNGLGTGETVAPLHDGNWHSYGNGPTNANRAGGGAPEPDEHERLASARWLYTPPVVHDGIVYFATDQRVVAVTTTGSEQWSTTLDTEVTGAPCLDTDRGRLYVPTQGGQTTDSSDPTPAAVTVFSISDGNVSETFSVGEDKTYGVTVVDGDIYARSATACVRLAPDGTERWRRSFDPLVYDEYNLGDFTATQIAPAVAADSVYTPDRNALVKLDAESGKEQWRVPVDTPYAAAVVDTGGVIQTGWQEIVAVDHSGEVRWRRDLHSRAAAAVGDGVIYVAAHELHELDAASGETNWQAHLPSEGTAAPVVTDDDILVVTGDVRAFRKDTSGILGPERVRWQKSSNHAAVYSSPVVAAGRVFVSGPAGLLALRPGEDE